MNTTIIIPFYNESNRINLLAYEAIFSKSSYVSFLLVNDGSTDDTFQIINNFALKFPHVKVLNLYKNVGKAEAIRRGVLALNNLDYIGYFDADLATPFSELLNLCAIIKFNTELQFVLGTRIKLIGNNVERRLFRHYLGRIFATIVSQFILKVPIYDTQCGAKIIRFQTAKEIFEMPFKTKWLFDVELLLRLKKFYNLEKVVKEVVLEEWKEINNSKLKWIDFIKVPFQLIILKFYDKK